MLVTGWPASRDVLSSRGSQSCCWGSRTHKHIFGPQTTLYTWPLPSQASGLLFFSYFYSVLLSKHLRIWSVDALQDMLSQSYEQRNSVKAASDREVGDTRQADAQALPFTSHAVCPPPPPCFSATLRVNESSCGPCIISGEQWAYTRLRLSIYILLTFFEFLQYICISFVIKNLKNF